MQHAQAAMSLAASPLAEAHGRRLDSIMAYLFYSYMKGNKRKTPNAICFGLQPYAEF